MGMSGIKVTRPSIWTVSSSSMNTTQGTGTPTHECKVIVIKRRNYCDTKTPSWYVPGSGRRNFRSNIRASSNSWYIVP